MEGERSSEEGNLPLHDEAKAREKWRGGETLLDEGEESSLPASEVDRAKTDNEGPSDDGRPGKGGPGTIPPPD